MKGLGQGKEQEGVLKSWKPQAKKRAFQCVTRVCVCIPDLRPSVLSIGLVTGLMGTLTSVRDFRVSVGQIPRAAGKFRDSSANAMNGGLQAVTALVKLGDSEGKEEKMGAERDYRREEGIVAVLVLTVLGHGKY